MEEKVVVTGLGTVASLGLDTRRFWTSLVESRSGILPLQGEHLRSLTVGIGAQILEFDPADHFPASEFPMLDRHTQFALVAATEAIEDAALTASEIRTAAAVIGTGCGGKETDEETYRRLYVDKKKRIHPFTIPRGMPSAAASQISIRSGITGPVFSVSSACASANHAVAQAMMMIRCGLVDVAVTGGADAPFTYGLLKAWEALRVLSEDTCRPFSAGRSGVVLGEGAAMLVLESLRHARKRKARIYAELGGCGLTADAGHITNPSLDGAARAMSAALRNAGISPDDVDYVNAHGTGTQINDVTETRAIRSVFGAHADRLVVSSTKSMHGHALGASGGLELIATVLAVKEGIVPATTNFIRPGAGCDLDYVPNQSRKMPIDAAISNSFAFGGLNAVLVIRSA